MNTCATCKHWQEEKWADSRLGVCRSVKNFGDCSWWVHNGTKNVIAIKAEFAHVKAFADDAREDTAQLLTRPDFGCVSHEPEAGNIQTLMTDDVIKNQQAAREKPVSKMWSNNLLVSYGGGGGGGTAGGGDGIVSHNGCTTNLPTPPHHKKPGKPT